MGSSSSMGWWEGRAGSSASADGGGAGAGASGFENGRNEDSSAERGCGEGSGAGGSVPPSSARMDLRGLWSGKAHGKVESWQAYTSFWKASSFGRGASSA